MLETGLRGFAESPIEPAATEGGRTGLRAVCAALALACLPALTRTVLSVPLHVSLNYNEGWNAYHAIDLARGDALYGHARAFFFNNYPPISFYVVAALAGVLGDPLITGRCISVAAFVAWTAMLAMAAVAFGCRRSEAWFAALLFAATTLLFTDYVGIDDPQLLGHAVAAAGLLAVQRAPRTVVRLCTGALLLVAGVFIKQNLIALPVAIVAWLLITDRRAGWRLMVIGASCGVIGYVACFAMFGPAFLDQFIEPRAFLPWKAISMSAQWTVRWALALACLWIIWRRRPHDQATLSCVIYVGVAGVLGFVLSGGAGVNWNVLFDANWAVCLSTAVVLNRWPALDVAGRNVDRRVMIAGACLLVPALAFGAAARRDWYSTSYWIAPRSAEAADAVAGIDFLAHHDGATLCEDLALCFWANQPVEVDFFSTQQRVRSGQVDPDEVVRLVEHRHFGAVQLEASPREIDRRVTDALRTHYRIDHEGLSGSYLLPR